MVPSRDHGVLVMADNKNRWKSLIGLPWLERDGQDAGAAQIRQVLQSVLDLLPEQVFWKDVKSIYQGCNKAYARALGLKSTSDVVGMSDYDMPWKKEEADWFRECDRKVIESGQGLLNLEEHLRLPDGTETFGITHKVPLRDSAGAVSGVLGVYTDTTERHLAAEKIRESEARFRSIVQSSPMGMHLYELNAAGDLILVDANQAADKFTGFNNRERLGRKILDAFPGLKDTDIPARYTRAAREGVPYQARDLPYQEDDIKGFFDVHAFRTAPGRVAVMFTNTTARKQAEEERERVFKLSPDLQCAATFDGIFRQVNPAWTRILGWSAEESQHKAWIDFVYADDRERTREVAAMLMSGQPLLGFENRCMCKDGSWRWLSWNAFPQVDERLVIAVARDITRQKELEQAMRAIVQGTGSAFGLDFLRNLVRCLVMALSADGALLATLEDGRVQSLRTVALWLGGRFQEPFSYEVTGTPGEEILRRGDYCLFQEVSSQFPAADLLQSYGIASYQGLPLRSATGELLGILTVMHRKESPAPEVSRDVLEVFSARAVAELERVRAEEVKSRLETQLRQAQKMEALGQLAGGVAHDFNNLLLAIRGYSDIALKSSPEGSRSHRAIQQIDRAANRAAGLTGQLLAFSRHGVFNPAPQDLNSVISDLLKMLSRVIGEQMDLTVKLQPDLKPVLIDRSQLEQVLINLCLNARDAMAGKGVLAIETENVSWDEVCRLGINALTSGDYVRVAVIDSGTGIPEAIRDRIFEPFFTTKETGKGTGLGLALAYAIVERHQGVITFQTELGKGTRFEVYLPSRVALRSEEKTATPSQPVLGGSETIMLAEDDELVGNLTTQVLREAGYTVLVARNGEEALEILEREKQRVKLALLDMVMPKFSGCEVKEIMTERGLHIPVLFSTGYPGEEHKNRCRPAPEEVLPKPYHPEDLLRRVRLVLDAQVQS